MALTLPRGVQTVPLKKVTYADFSGGLDYLREEHELDSKFSSDAENVEFLPGGGFRSRRCLAPFTTDTLTATGVTAAVLFMGRFEQSTGTRLMLSMSDGKVRQVTNGPAASTLVHDPGVVSTRAWRGCQVNNKWYMMNGHEASRSYDGTTVTVLGQAWNENLAAPTSGNMPIAELCCFYHGRMIVAKTVEMGTSYPNRVRFSHPVVQGTGQEDFRVGDSVEVAVGADDQGITAMHSNGRAMFVFKQHSVHQVTGFDSTSFSFDELDTTIGTPNPNSVCSTDSAVYFWDQRQGLMAVVRTPLGSSIIWQVKPLAQQIVGLLRDGLVDNSRSSEVALGTDGDKVWCTLPWSDGTTRVLMFDVRTNSWTKFVLNLGPYLNYVPVYGAVALLAFNRDPTQRALVLRTEVDADGDNLGNGIVPFSWFYRTAWLHDNEPHAQKKWLYLSAVIEGQGNLTVEVAADWAEGNVIGSMDLTTGTVRPLPFVYDRSRFAIGSLERLTPLAAVTAVPDEDGRATDFAFASRHPLSEEVRVPIPMDKQTSSEALQLLWIGSGYRWIVTSFALNYYPESRVG